MCVLWGGEINGGTCHDVTKANTLGYPLCPTARYTRRYTISFARAYHAELRGHMPPGFIGTQSYKRVAVGPAPAQERTHEYTINEVAEIVPPVLSKEYVINA